MTSGIDNALSDDFERPVVVSNRLPAVIEADDQGEFQVKSGSGGLVTALEPVLKRGGGVWLGWPGLGSRGGDYDAAVDDVLARSSHDVGYTLRAVHLRAEEVEDYYAGFSNRILWPLFHDLLSHCDFQPRYWRAYQQVNRRFAEAIAENTGERDLVWVQDYHLMLVARLLAEAGVERTLGYFLHIPFPPLDMFRKLPWWEQLLDALLEYRLIGFQTLRDRRNFTNCVRHARPETRIRGRGKRITVEHEGGVSRVGAFPISIDFSQFAGGADTEDVAKEAWHLHERVPSQKLILGLDRLDYSKGIPHRLRAFDNALERYPELHGAVTLFQVVVPSRTQVYEYQQLKREIERLVGEINGRYARLGWTPIQYVFRSVSPLQLLALYRTCEIALLTPLKDGMNIIAKEYCAANVDEQGVLILSEMAGAAAQLHRNAIIVNPFDYEGVADAIHEAYHLPPEERRGRMRRLRRSIRRADVFAWASAFLEAAQKTVTPQRNPGPVSPAPEMP